MREDIATWFDNELGIPKDDPPVAEYTAVGHGRMVKYALETTTALNEYIGWPGMQQAFRLRQTTRTPKTSTPQETIFYGVTSLDPNRASPDALISLWRQHWHIENGLHWVRDVVFDEDLSQVRTGSLPQTMTILRNLVLNALRIHGYRSIKSTRTRFAANPGLALGLLE